MLGLSVGLIIVFIFSSAMRVRSQPLRQAVDAGYRDFAYSAAGVTAPTGDKPQSKLWFNDGLWWGALFNRSTEAYQIYVLDAVTQNWSDTGTLLDERNESRIDALWDGTHLYIATAGPKSSNITHSGRLLRFSYDQPSRRYTIDPGFPVMVSVGGMEAIVLEKDTTGQLWVTYTQNNRVYVNTSKENDQTWGAPFIPPVSGTTVDSDDISAVVAFRGFIGIMWSNHLDDTIYFAIHRDTFSDDVWQSAQIALRGNKEADDHLNLKSLEADASGQVFAVIKTSRNDEVNADPNAPLIRVLILGTGGTWKNVVFGRVRDDHTRPLLLIDTSRRLLYVFATAGVFGGTIYYKQANLDNVAFTEGRGIPFIQSATDQRINNATSTKQKLNTTTGMLVL